MEELQMPLVPRGEVLGDPEFIELYRSTYASAVRLAYRLVGSHQAAEDIVQDVFAGLHIRFHQVENREAYLRSGIERGSKNHWRRWTYDQRRLARVRPVDVPATSRSELFDALMKLPYRQRAVLVLRYWADWPEAEIAEALQCRPGAVRQLAHRALVRLRKEIRP